MGQGIQTFSVQDANGCPASGTATVLRASDLTPPTIVCPTNISVGNDNGVCGATVTFNGASATDDCGLVSVVQTSGGASGSVFGIGSTTVAYTAVDGSGNTAACSFTVTVSDVEAPTVVCPGNIAVNNDAGQCGAVVSFSATGSDNCPGVAVVQTAGGASGSLFAVGSSAVSFVATDAAGNTAACAFTVTVTDSEAPSVTCPASVFLTNDPGLCSAIATFSASGSDNCPGVSVSQVSGGVSGSAFPVGTSTVTFAAVDANGNTASCSFSVAVVDAEAPNLTCGNAGGLISRGNNGGDSLNFASFDNDVTLPNDNGVCGALYEYDNEVTDNCPVVTVVQTAGLSSGSSFPVGTTTNTFVATDAAGNSTSCSFVVTVVDVQAPVANCPGNITLSNDAGQCSAVATFAATASDNCPGVSIAQTSGGASGSAFAVGSSTVVFQATDASGNSATCSFTVTVNDTEAPALDCGIAGGLISGPNNSFDNDVTLASDNGACGAMYEYDNEATDNCPGVTVAQTAGLPSGSTFPTGSTTNTFVATDASGNSTVCSFIVTVVDAQAPTVTCPANISVNTDPGLCSAVVSYNATATDNCPGVTVSINPASGSTFATGTTTVNVVATDAAGNLANCSFTVTVVDNQLPVITCPASQTLCAVAGTTAGVAIFGNATASDNCPGVAVVQTAGLPSGSSFPVGNNTVTFTATDASGNSANCSFTVTVSAFQGNSQVFAERIGTVTGTTLIAAHEGANGFDNDGYTMSGTADVRNTLPSTGYPGASGGANVFFTGAGRTFEISGVNTTGFTTMGMAFGVFKSTTTSNGLDLRLEVSTDGITYTTLPHTLLPTGTGTAVWSTMTAVGFPSAANLRIRFTNLGTTQYRIDDMILGGLTNVATITNVGNTSFCSGGSVTLVATQAAGYLWSTGETTQSITVNTAGNYSVTVTSANGCSAIAGPVAVSVFPNPSVSATSVNATCPGVANGSATALVVGGTPNYTYLWTPGGQTGVTASNIGAGTYSVQVTDANGCTATSNTVTVTDNDIVPPVANCQSVTVQLNSAGQGSTNAAAVNNGSTDNCGITGIALNNSNFSCANVGSSNTVILTVTDVGGNTSTCSATVTVQDVVAPVALCQNVTVQLDNSGNATITASAINNGSSDACGIASTTLNNGSFSCANVNGTPASSLFISEYTEGSSNNKCIEIFNGTGAAVNLSGYSLRYYFNGSTSATTIINLTGTVANGDVYVVCDDNAAVGMLAQADVTSTSNFFNGDDAIELRNGTTAVDIIGRIGQDPGTEWTGGGLGTMDRTLVRNSAVNSGNTSNAVGFPSLASEWTGLATDDFSNLGSHNFSGANNVVLTVTDVNGNSSTCSASVTVQDNVAPSITCPANITVSNDAGLCSAVVSYTATGADNCSATVGYSIAPGSVFAQGSTTVTATATDPSGNAVSCTFTVTVNDTEAPVVTCPANISVSNDAGNCSAVVTFAATASDNCGIASIVEAAASGSTFAVGTTTVVATATDIHGNTAACSFTVTVNDTEAPVANCQAVTVQLDANGAGSITTADVNNGSSDNCGIASLSLDNSSFGCANVGNVNTVVLTVTDIHGNSSNCSATVTVVDNVAPLAVCQSITVNAPNSGSVSITASQIDGGSSDACGIASLSVNPNSFSCSNQGPNTVTLTVTDVNGNVSSCTATVTVTSPAITVSLSSPVNGCGFNVSSCCATGNGGSGSGSGSGSGHDDGSNGSNGSDNGHDGSGSGSGSGSGHGNNGSHSTCRHNGNICNNGGHGNQGSDRGHDGSGSGNLGSGHGHGGSGSGGSGSGGSGTTFSVVKTVQSTWSQRVVVATCRISGAMDRPRSTKLV
ncbi:MAG: HYR domain-containing protein [Bacteroidetes bacterium]|nr:HYR domain-containing protein [Bacteroidota bacterium]